MLGRSESKVYYIPMQESYEHEDVVAGIATVAPQPVP